jgi:hypothetical protein
MCTYARYFTLKFLEQPCGFPIPKYHMTFPVTAHEILSIGTKSDLASISIGALYYDHDSIRHKDRNDIIGYIYIRNDRYRCDILSALHKIKQTDTCMAFRCYRIKIRGKHFHWTKKTIIGHDVLSLGFALGICVYNTTKTFIMTNRIKPPWGNTTCV